MINSRLLIVLCFFIFIQCKPKAQKNTTQSESSAQESNPSTQQAFQIKLLVTSTKSYCGGARPSDELLEELRTPVPRANYSLFIRAGNVNDIKRKYIKEVVTDSNGIAIIRLPKGVYSIVDINKKDMEVYTEFTRKFDQPNDVFTAVDINCYDNYIKTPDLIVNLQKDTAIDFNYALGCSYQGYPCVKYIGQLPK